MLVPPCQSSTELRFRAAQQKHFESFHLNASSEILDTYKSPDSGSCKNPRISHWEDSAVHSDLTDIILLTLIKGSLYVSFVTRPLYVIQGVGNTNEKWVPLPSSPHSSGDTRFLPRSRRR